MLNMTEFEKLHPKLQLVHYALYGFVKMNYGKELRVTQMFSDKDSSSVHAYFRGLDEGTKEFRTVDVIEMEKFINGFFGYDPARPEKMVCINERTIADAPKPDKWSGAHFHLQVRDETQLR